MRLVCKDTEEIKQKIHIDTREAALERAASS